jgi:hypothetical protein
LFLQELTLGKEPAAMTTRPRRISVALISFVAALTGCNYQVVTPPAYLSVAILPRPTSIPQGTSVIFTGTVSNNLSLPQWSILDASYSANPGTLTPISGSPNSILYTAPASPPIYGVTPTGITQGSVTIDVSVSDPAGTSIPISSDAVTVAITSPSVVLSLAPTTTSVPLLGTEQFIGYAVGNTNNSLTWQVNGVTGGSTDTGTINTAGTYIAPANLPMSGNTVTVTIISQADPTKTASAAVSLH